VTESRQQRRARERAERKAAVRPGPNPAVTPTAAPAPGPADPRPRDYEVEVYRTEPDPGDPDDVPGWSAEGGLAGESIGVDYDWTDSLAGLADQVRDETAGYRQRYPALRIVWRLDGDEEAMAAAAAQDGVELPR
jgi:hypothetical protein